MIRSATRSHADRGAPRQRSASLRRYTRRPHVVERQMRLRAGMLDHLAGKLRRAGVTVARYDSAV
jgi:hypothetical protein